jgi:alpha-glucosidase (family GH31 glycosyl hydrolase)
VRNDVDAWMFGDSLLVAPVVTQGQTRKSIYLPHGTWIDWFTGQEYTGGQTIEHTVDATGWSDIPLYIREGAIIPLQPPMDYVGERPLTTLEVELFPAAVASRFDYYDDDGSSYAYEHGAYFLQQLDLQQEADTVHFTTQPPSGSFKPALADYLLKFHGRPATAVSGNGQALAKFDSIEALREHAGEGWATGHDRFGTVTFVKLAAGTARALQLTLARP